MTKTEIKFEQSVEKALKTALMDYPEAQPTVLKLKELLIVKGKEYRRNSDPYHNFNKGARMLETRPMLVLEGFRLKHVISIGDLLQDFREGKHVSKAQVNEKYDDILVYTLIELAYNESENQASFNVYNDFVYHLTSKLNFIKKLDKVLSSNKESRCCGRCDGVNDLCVADTTCEVHEILGCEICFGER